MTTFLEWLEDEKANVSEFHKPEREAKKEEKELAEMSDDLRRLYTVRHNLKLKLEEMIEGTDDWDEMLEADRIRIRHKNDFLNLVDHLYRVQLEVDAGTIGTEIPCGVRKGYKIVVPHRDPVEILSMILGINPRMIIEI